MQLLWERGSATVAETRAELGDQLAYTTVLTILRNLERKKLVRRADEGRAHRYFPRLTLSVARRQAVKELLDRYFNGKPVDLVLYLASERLLFQLSGHDLYRQASEMLVGSPHATRSAPR